MSEESKSSGAAIWVAVIGALVTGGGYLFAYYKDISIQDRNQEHDLVVKLLTEDSRESSRNLVWAHDAGLISLSEKTITKLKDKPYEGPTRSGAGKIEETPFEDAIPSEDIVALVRGLDAGSKSMRSRSLQTLLDETSNSKAKTLEAIAASNAALSGEQLEAFSANGRFNNLYFLSRVDWSGVDARLRNQTMNVLDNILSRGNEGIAAVGPQTKALIETMKTALK